MKILNDVLLIKRVAIYCIFSYFLRIGFYHVKHHYFALMEFLTEMRRLGKGDKSIKEGVKKFHEEAFANIIMGMLDCLLKVKTKEEKRPLHVSSPIDIKTLLERREKELIAI